MKFTETQLQKFAAPLSAAEDQKCQVAIGMVSDSLKSLGFSDNGKSITKMINETYAYMLEMSNTATNRNVKIFIKGSYANNTNVRTDSDVDIAIVEEDVFLVEYRAGATDENYGIRIAQPRTMSFKDEVQRCLVDKFKSDVQRMNKSIKVHGNNHRKDADAVPCKRLRNYLHEYANNPNDYIGGIVITADDTTRIVNYPEQHIAHGYRKDIETKLIYKPMVRIVKSLRNIMKENKYSSADNVSSFGVESLLWNVIKEAYLLPSSTFGSKLKTIVDYLFYNNNSDFDNYKEANGIKPLFESVQKKIAYRQFIVDLRQFYEHGA